jgi:hypothetical protein
MPYVRIERIPAQFEELEAEHRPPIEQENRPAPHSNGITHRRVNPILTAEPPTSAACVEQRTKLIEKNLTLAARNPSR